MSENIEKAPNVPPFVRFVASAVPMVFDDSMSYYEALSALWKYMQDTVDIINNNATVTEEYIQLTDEMKEYMDNYFDNLDVQEEINNKLDAMVEDGTFQDLLDAYFPKKVDYYHITSSSTSAEIAAAFAVNNAKVIEFDSGTYTLSNDLILTSNTTVNLNGATITRSSTSYWLLGYSRDSEYTAYSGIHNVEFNNGSIQMPIALMHNADIKFTNITFLPINDHAIQMASCKHIVIDSCAFDGRVIDDTKADHFETVQMETATRGGQPFLTDENSPSYDHGINYDVQILNCKFLKGDGETSRNYTAIGHHSDDDTNHFFMENITIKGCTFESSYYSQLCPAGFNNAVIENCLFNQSDEYSEVYNIRFRYQNKNFIIRNNTFIGGYANINNVNMGVFGTNLLIENNSFSTTDSGNLANIAVRNWDGAVIRNNKFGSAQNHNILLSGDGTNPCLNVTVEGNEFADANLSTSTDASLVYLRRCTNTKVVFNKVKITEGINFTYITTADCTNYAIANNFIDFLTNTNYKPVSGSSGWNSINVKNVPMKCWEASGANYAAITSQALASHHFADFDTINLLLHKTGAGGKMFIGLVKGYAINGKLDTSSQRIYCFYYNDGTDTFQGTLTIKTDGTFSYSSSTNNLTLRAIYGINTI